MTPLWISKHQMRLPAVFIAFFPLTSDANTSSLLDNKLKSEIANLKSTLGSTSYKTKLVVILLGEDVIPPAELEERISVMRRSAALDGKSLYFLPFGSSNVEIIEFVRHILSSLHPSAIEYYRDLSKHARRKRNRPTIPQPTSPLSSSTAHMLPASGWSVRYEFKLAVLAEFRQEMDAACRNYESAYQNMFSAELIDSIPMESPRFAEARILGDIIAFRTIRCQLWTGQVTAAVRLWTNHRNKVGDLLRRPGAKIELDSWEVWQSSWSKTMAELISKVEFQFILKEANGSPGMLIFAPFDKHLNISDRTTPWEQLHHEGYWLRNAVRHLQARRPPSVSQEYEHRRPLDHGLEILSMLEKAVEKYSAAKQQRTVEYLRIQLAKTCTQLGDWPKAMATLQQLWKQNWYRKAGWWEVLGVVGEVMEQCAREVQDPDTIVRVEWELLSTVVSSSIRRHDIHGALTNDVPQGPGPSVVLVAEQTSSAIVPSFVFMSAEGSAGEPLRAQLVLESHLQNTAAPIRISEIKIVFEGSLRPVHVLMEEGIQNDTAISIADLVLQDSATISGQKNKRSSGGLIASLIGFTDLTISPNQTRIFNMLLTPREAGGVSVVSITLMINDPNFSISFVMSQLDGFNCRWWDSIRGSPVARRVGMGRDATTIKIQPKPPKLSISTPDLKNSYYTNEDINVELQFSNEEEEAITGVIEVRLVGPLDKMALAKWVEKDVDESRPLHEVGEGQVILPRHEIVRLERNAKTSRHILVFQTVAAVDHELEIAVTYFLESDSETPLRKLSIVEIPVVRPFEANYKFQVQLDPEPWPSFFGVPEDLGPQEAVGLKQLFKVTCSVCSFASEELVVEDASLSLEEITAGTLCETAPNHRRVGGTALSDGEQRKYIKPEESQDFIFDMTLQKVLLGDRNIASIDLRLDILWRRVETEHINTSSLDVPRFIAPMAEPRVLLTIKDNEESSVIPGLCQLIYTIENPSMHYLTLNLNMESSDQFAFSGPKASVVKLVPISRRDICYSILSMKSGEWVKVNLNVVDPYFGKTLQVQPGGNNVRIDKKGIVSVLIPPSADDNRRLAGD